MRLDTIINFVNDVQGTDLDLASNGLGYQWIDPVGHWQLDFSPNDTLTLTLRIEGQAYASASHTTLQAAYDDAVLCRIAYLKERLSAVQKGSSRNKGSAEWFRVVVQSFCEQLGGRDFRVGTNGDQSQWWGSFTFKNQCIHCSNNAGPGWRVSIQPTHNDVEYIKAVGTGHTLQAAYRSALPSFIEQWQEAGRKMQRLVEAEVEAAQKALKALDAG